jgi:hypothetical protein
VYRSDENNGEITEKIGGIFFNEKNPTMDTEKAFTYFKKAIKNLKSEGGKRVLAQKMFDICQGIGKENEMRKFKEWLPEDTQFAA